MNLDLILKAAGLLKNIGDLIAGAPDALAAAEKFAPSVKSALDVLTGKITGDEALADILAKQADIDAHFAHMEAEAAKLGT